MDFCTSALTSFFHPNILLAPTSLFVGDLTPSLSYRRGCYITDKAGNLIRDKGGVCLPFGHDDASLPDKAGEFVAMTEG